MRLKNGGVYVIKKDLDFSREIYNLKGCEDVIIHSFDVWVKGRKVVALAVDENDFMLRLYGSDFVNSFNNNHKFALSNYLSNIDITSDNFENYFEEVIERASVELSEIRDVCSDVYVNYNKEIDKRFYFQYENTGYKVCDGEAFEIPNEGIINTINVDGRFFNISNNYAISFIAPAPRSDVSRDLSGIKEIKNTENSKTKNENKKIERKEDSKMNIGCIGVAEQGRQGIFGKMFGDFGAITDGRVALTFSGELAVKTSDGNFISYNGTKKVMENQENLVIESTGMAYIMPVKSVEAGDTIKYKDKYLHVLCVEESGDISAIDVEAGTKESVIKEVSVFGFNFYSKVINIFSGVGNNKSTNGINPMMLAMLAGGDGEDSSDMLPMMLMMQMQDKDTEKEQALSPMMMAMMMSKKDGDGDFVKDMMMMNMFSGGSDMFSGSGDGQINPLLMMAMLSSDKKDKKGLDIKDMMMMQMLTQQQKVPQEVVKTAAKTSTKVTK